MRVEKGLSPRQLSYAIYAAGYGSVDRKTIERIERGDCEPRVRVQFALAQFFERPVTSIWPVKGAPPLLVTAATAAPATVREEAFA